MFVFKSDYIYIKIMLEIPNYIVWNASFVRLLGAEKVYL